METIYRHKQTGWAMRAIIVAPAPFLLLLGPTSPSAGSGYWFTAAIIALQAIGLMFTSLTIEVDARELRWSFGPGVWQKRILRENIASAMPVTNPFLYGWGIHRTPRGWLYNVGGYDAVEIMQKDGVILRLGTDEPQKLARALGSA